MTPIGPHSRPHKLAVIDGRRAEARRMRTIRAELTAHVGGKPSATQKMMIERIATLLLRIELMDRRALKEGDMTERDTRSYLAWANAVTRMLRQIGLQGAATKAPSLAEYLAAKPASTPQAAA